MQSEPWQRFKQRLGHFFLHYGAGAHLFDPLRKLFFWNALLWTSIVLGIILWVFIFAWLSPPLD